MDINMPGMNGWTCLIEVKKDERFKDVPVIMYSTSSQKRDIDIAMSHGALCFCVKPENFKTLTHIIKAVSENLGKNLLHQQLDKAVDKCYRPAAFESETKRIEYLFELYEKYTAGLFAGEGKKRKATKNK